MSEPHASTEERDLVAGLAEQGRRLIVTGVARGVPWIIRRSLRRGLAGIYLRGSDDALRGGAILAPNHHSWWDAYLAWYLAQRARAPLAALMDEAQLRRFPFFRPHGAIDVGRPRDLVRRVQSGALGVVFPEGAIRPAGPPSELAPGAVRIAGWASAPLHPVALRVVLRGLERPEAFVAFGPAVTTEADLAEELASAVAELDAWITSAHPERVPEGATVWLRGASSPDRSGARIERLWREPE